MMGPLAVVGADSTLRLTGREKFGYYARFNLYVKERKVFT